MKTKPETIKTKLHYYYFNTRDEKDAAAYKELSDRLTSEGLTLFDSISPDHSKFYNDLIKPLDGEEIELETSFLFENQWNTAATKTSDKGLRVFDWAEGIAWNNRSIKQGMYLEQTEEMRQVRALTYKCGYCGKNYFRPQQSFCDACIGFEYLTEDRLPLLFLIPIDQDKTRYDGINLPDGFVEEFNIKHAATMTAKLKARQAAKLASIKKDIANSELEYEAFEMLIAAGVDFDNVIYYSHTQKFSFGWRQFIPDEDRPQLEERLKACGFADRFAYEFHKG